MSQQAMLSPINASTEEIDDALFIFEPVHPPRAGRPRWSAGPKRQVLHTPRFLE